MRQTSASIYDVASSIEPPFDRTQPELYWKLWDQNEPPARVLGRLDVLLSAWRTAHEQPRAQLPPRLQKSYPYFFHELEKRMPALSALQSDHVLGALELFGIPDTEKALVDGIMWDWLGSLSFHGVRVVMERCAAIRTHPEFATDSFISITTPLADHAEAEMAELIISHLALVGREKALPLLRNIRSKPGQARRIVAHARNYEQWVLTEMEDQR